MSICGGRVEQLRKEKVASHVNLLLLAEEDKKSQSHLDTRIDIQLILNYITSQEIYDIAWDWNMNPCEMGVLYVGGDKVA